MRPLALALAFTLALSACSDDTSTADVLEDSSTPDASPDAVLDVVNPDVGDEDLEADADELDQADQREGDPLECPAEVERRDHGACENDCGCITTLVCLCRDGGPLDEGCEARVCEVAACLEDSDCGPHRHCADGGCRQDQ